MTLRSACPVSGHQRHDLDPSYASGYTPPSSDRSVGHLMDGRHGYRLLRFVATGVHGIGTSACTVRLPIY